MANAPAAVFEVYGLAEPVLIGADKIEYRANANTVLYREGHIVAIIPVDLCVVNTGRLASEPRANTLEEAGHSE